MVTSLLLVPVPVLATYTLGPWSVTQPAGNTWSANSSSGFDLIITPKSGAAGVSPVQIDFTAPVTFSGTTNNVTASSLNFDQIHTIIPFTSGGGLTVTIGFLKSNGTLDSIIFQNSNQFTGTLPPSLAPMQSVTVGGEAKTALVRFVFTGLATWQAVPSSSVHVSFTPGT